ncbi:hypothetical protein ACH4T9_26490 [Micromonospora sp. NPDC020750]
MWLSIGRFCRGIRSNGTLAAIYKYDPYGNNTTTDETNLGTTNLIR